MPRVAKLTVKIQPAELVAAAKEESGISTDRQLAREMARFGFDPISTTDSVGRWRRGPHQPDYAPTMALLELAGWLDQKAIHRWEERAATREAQAAQRAVQEALDESESQGPQSRVEGDTRQ